MADGIINQIQLPDGRIYDIGDDGTELELASSYNASNQEVTLFMQPVTD